MRGFDKELVKYTLRVSKKVIFFLGGAIRVQMII